MSNVNQNDATLWLEWGGDFEISQNGSLVLAYGWDQVRQRILRRLLTNPAFTLDDGTPVPPDYLFDPKYGLGFRRRVGENWTPDLQLYLKAMINQAVLIDEGVNVNLPPLINITQTDHTVQVVITVYLKTGQPGVIALQISQ